MSNESEDPTSLSDIIASMPLVDGSSTTELDSDNDRAETIALRDAEHEQQDHAEVRADLIERSKAGEQIDPDALQHAGELLLESTARLQQIKQPITDNADSRDNG